MDVRRVSKNKVEALLGPVGAVHQPHRSRTKPKSPALSPQPLSPRHAIGKYRP